MLVDGQGRVPRLTRGVEVLGVYPAYSPVTLPIEWDASFRRALPVLQQRNYLVPEDEQGPAAGGLFEHPASGDGLGGFR
ncbi:MAG: zinc metallopeptidase [Nitrospiraceae bacterium]